MGWLRNSLLQNRRVELPDPVEFPHPRDGFAHLRGPQSTLAARFRVPRMGRAVPRMKKGENGRLPSFGGSPRAWAK